MCYRYNGTIEKLKSIGYTFNKLYARNYIVYSKNDFFLFKASKMIVEVINLSMEDQHPAIKFVLDNKDKGEDFWTVESKFFKNTRLPVWCVVNNKIVPNSKGFGFLITK